MKVHALLGLTVLAAPACGDASGPAELGGVLSIHTDRPEYRPVEPILVTTTNATGATVFDDRSGGEVQGFEYLGRWNAGHGVSRACACTQPDARENHNVPIPPGAAHVDTLHVNGRAYEGTWRVEL